MNDQIPTPETDRWAGLGHNINRLIGTSRDLEQRLTVARDALAQSLDWLSTCRDFEGDASELAAALTQTAPKP